MRVIIAGCRNFEDYDLLRDYCDKVLVNQDDVTIVSGRARGADTLGERYAEERGHKLLVFPADWEKYGKSAGHKRNAQMADNADALIAFWDKESRGTASMIHLANKKGLKIRVKHI